MDWNDGIDCMDDNLQTTSKSNLDYHLVTKKTEKKMGSYFYFNRYQFWALISSLEVLVLGMYCIDLQTTSKPYLYYLLGDKKANTNFGLR